MRRHSFFLIALFVAFYLTATTVKAGTSQPNVVLILADDLGSGDVQVMNAKSSIPTPNLDQLADYPEVAARLEAACMAIREQSPSGRHE